MGRGRSGLRICHVTTGHSLLDDRIFHKEALSLSHRGHTVFVLGPSSLTETEMKGIKLEPVSPSRLSWRPMAKFSLLLKIEWRLLCLRCHVYHCHEMDAALAALPAALLGSRIVYDVHEHFPENYAGRLAPPWLVLLRLLDRFVSRIAHLVITVDETLARKYSSARRVLVIHNYPSFESYASLDASGDSSLAVYVGGLSEERGVWEMVEAIHLARAECPDLKLLMVGRFIPESLKQRVQARIEEFSLSDAIQIIDWIPFESIPDTIGKSGVGLSFLRDLPRYRAAIPIKVYEYMAAGIPVIASDFEGVTHLLRTEKCGITARPESAEALSKALLVVVRNPESARAMGRHGRMAVKRKYNWEMESASLCASYEEI